MHGIKIPQQDFALKMGGLIREGKAYLWDTTVLVLHRRLLLLALCRWMLLKCGYTLLATPCSLCNSECCIL